jgi:outer membrane protein assembly factor BamB
VLKHIHLKGISNLKISIVVQLFLIIGMANAATPVIKHTILVSGTGLDYIGIIDSTGKIVWKHDEAEAGNGQKNDCWLLPNGNVVYSYQWGVRIVNVRTDKVIWDRPTPKRNNQGGETHSCQPLDGGSSKFLIGECFQDTAFIVEVDTTKQETRRIALKNQGGGTHGKWRQIRKTPQNTYLVSSYDLHHSFEYDTTGKLIYDFPAGGYVATRLENGNTLIATGEDCRFVEFGANGTNIWEINNTSSAVGGLGIGFGSEAQRLPNGNTIITNWGGHGSGFGAAVVEIKPDRTVVGTLPASFPTRIASVKVIDGWKFPVTQFTVTASAVANGTIEPSGAIAIDSSSGKTFVFKADDGYSVDSVKIDGVNVGALQAYTFEKVNANHSIVVTFKKSVNIRQTQEKVHSADTPRLNISSGGNLSCVVPFMGETEISVFDCNGKLFTRKKVKGPGTFQVRRNLAYGMYLVIIKSNVQRFQWSEVIQW